MARQNGARCYYFGFDTDPARQSKFIARGGQSGVMENTIAKSMWWVLLKNFSGLRVLSRKCRLVLLLCLVQLAPETAKMPINVTIIKSFILMHLFREGQSKRQMVR